MLLEPTHEHPVTNMTCVAKCLSLSQDHYINRKPAANAGLENGMICHFYERPRITCFPVCATVKVRSACVRNAYSAIQKSVD